MNEEDLQQLILELLEKDIYKTTDQVTEEFRIEYPTQWRLLEKEGEMLFGTGCSSIQQPATRISQVLLILSEDKCFCLRKNKICYWKR